MHFWSFWAKYWHFCPWRPKTNGNKVPRWVFRYVGKKTFDLSSKKRIFCPKTTKFSPKLAFLSIAGSFGALLVGRLVVVTQGLYYARHLFTLSHYCGNSHIRHCVLHISAKTNERISFQYSFSSAALSSKSNSSFPLSDFQKVRGISHNF